MTPCILVMYVSIHGYKQGTFMRRTQLPLIQKGMGIVLHRGCDPVDVEDVFINGDNEVVVSLENSIYQQGDIEPATPEAFESQWRYETDGWEPAEKQPFYGVRNDAPHLSRG